MNIELMPGVQQPQVAEVNGVFRYVPLACMAMVLLCFIFVSLKIIGYGYLPEGDARRHVARAISEKPITELLVLRPEYTMDHSPGWEAALRWLHREAGWKIDALVSFGVITLLLCVWLAPLPWLGRPEAWLAALLAQMIAIPELMSRLTQARPFLLTEGVLIAILFAWSKPGSGKPSWLKLGLTAIGVTLSVWMHGAWYLWVLPLAAFFLAGAWRQALWLAGCWLAGTFCGALMTGAPIVFLKQAVFMATAVFQENAPQWMLVGEFRPSYGEFSTVVLIALVALWHRAHGKSWQGWSQPVFWLLLISWMGGFKADRFWADWGVPAALVWLAMQFQELMVDSLCSTSPKRLALCGLLAIPLFFHSTNDLDRRYTKNLTQSFIDASDPALTEWLPEKGGIFYAAEMEFFYNTFFKNPTAQWRYLVAYEPALMPVDDLKVLRRIQWNRGVLKAYQPWVDKMRPQDRLVIPYPSEPNLPPLEWTNAVGNLWIGRLPASANKQ